MSTLVYEQLFDALPDDWNVYSTERSLSSNVSVERSVLNIETKITDKGWRGGSISYPVPFTYGKFVVRVRADPAVYTKALLMLWPAGSWPPEIDFLEMGGTDNWDRQHNALAVHYGADNAIVHRSYAADMTTWHTVSVEWRSTFITFRLDGVVQRNLWGDLTTKVVNPGVHVPLKIHAVCWPTHKEASDPWPERPSRMQVDWVRVYS